MKPAALKLMFYASATLCALCIGIIALNLYDYAFSDVLPWREGDLERVLLRSFAAAAAFGFLAINLYPFVRRS